MAESLDISGITLKRLLGHTVVSSDVTSGYVISSTQRLRAAAQRVEDEILRMATRRVGDVVSLRNVGVTS